MDAGNTLRKCKFHLPDRGSPDELRLPRQFNDLRYSLDDDTIELDSKLVQSLDEQNKISGARDQREASCHEFELKKYDIALSVSQQVDELIDHAIEIESNKKMIKDNVKWFALSFRNKELESKVRVKVISGCFATLQSLL